MNSLKKVLGLTVVFLCLFNFQQLVSAESDIQIEDEQEQSNMYENLLMKLNIDELEHYWRNVQQDYGEFIPDKAHKNLLDLMKNDDSITIKSGLKGIISFFLYEIIENGQLLGSLIILTLFSVILQSMHAAFEKSAISKIAYFVVYIVLLYIVLDSFHQVFTYAKNAMEMMSGFMIALLPLLLGIIATFGQFFSVTFFHPIIIFMIHVSGILISSFVFPLLYLSALLIIISNLNKQFQAIHLAELLKTISLSTLGIFLTVFLGVMSVQGTATAIQDGVALKTTKFITGNFIPVVGRTFTDAADTVLSAALLLKNAVGLIGVTVIIFIAVFPAIKIMAISFIYKLAAALLQPLGNSPIVESLNVISKYIMYVLAALVIVTFMFFLAIVMITVASNIPLLLN